MDLKFWYYTEVLLRPRKNIPVGWIENNPVLSLVIVKKGIARSIGRLPGDVILEDGRSSIRCNAIFSR